VTRLVTAVRYLTIVPIPGRAPAHERPGMGAAWFPVVGVFIGALLLLTDRVVTALFAPLLAALLTVTVWKVVTGGLHLDGLADCLDGLAGSDATRRLAIMHDSRIGTFGALGLILFLMLELATVIGIETGMRWKALLVAPVIGRAMPPLLARLFRPLASGHGARFHADLGPAAPAATIALAAVTAVAFLAAWGLLALAVSIALTIAIGAFMSRRLGGVSGDVHGAVVELGELAVLLTVAAVTPAR
jgi:adenosylcobinamide-GDP ribazoletransferase